MRTLPLQWDCWNFSVLPQPSYSHTVANNFSLLITGRLISRPRTRSKTAQAVSKRAWHFGDANLKLRIENAVAVPVHGCWVLQKDIRGYAMQDFTPARASEASSEQFKLRIEWFPILLRTSNFKAKMGNPVSVKPLYKFNFVKFLRTFHIINITYIQRQRERANWIRAAVNLDVYK